MSSNHWELQGEADRIRSIGFAEAEKTKAIGLASAEATEKQVAAYGGPEYQLHSQVLLRFAEAIEKGKLPLVPNIAVGGGRDGQGGGSLVEAMLAMLLAEKNGAGGKGWQQSSTERPKAPSSPASNPTDGISLNATWGKDIS